LPRSSQDRIFPLLRPIDLTLGEVLYDPGQSVDFLYFPANSLVSLISLMQNGQSSELALVGPEGVVGVAAFLGGNNTPFRSVVQSAGTGLRLPAKALQEEFEKDPGVRRVLLRYIQSLITNLAQSGACNRHHSIEQQLSRWLLTSMDRLDTDELNMTQELIANMLGVRREGVTEAAGRLQRDGMIHYKRGHIKVLDRARLESSSCECYAVVNREMKRLNSFFDED